MTWVLPKAETDLTKDTPHIVQTGESSVRILEKIDSVAYEKIGM